MQIVVNIDNNLYTRLFDNGETDAADMLKACTAIRKGDVLSQRHGLKIMAKLPPIEEMAKKVAEEALDNIYMGKTLREWIDAVKQTRWIPVSERLPDKLHDVLITFYDAEGEYDVAYMRKTFNEIYKAHGSENEWVSSMGETTYADYEVSAWMPIEPYKAESEEEQ